MNNDAVDMAILLSRLAQELAALEDSGRGLERMFAVLIAESAEAPAGLQEMDRHVQRLGDLAAFTRRLASAAPHAPISVRPLAHALKLDHSRAALLAARDGSATDHGDDLFFDA